MILASVGLAVALFTGCSTMNSTQPAITKADFGKTTDGQAVEIYTLKNPAGMEANVLTYGGIV